MIELKRTGYVDDWGRPMYRDKDGTKYVDINLGENSISPHTVTPDWGEPDCPIIFFKIVEEFSL